MMVYCLALDDQETLSKDEALPSPDSELLIGRFPDVRLMEISLLQPEPKRLKRHQDVVCEGQVRVEIFRTN